MLRGLAEMKEAVSRTNLLSIIPIPSHSTLAVKILQTSKNSYAAIVQTHESVGEHVTMSFQIGVIKKGIKLSKMTEDGKLTCFVFISSISSCALCSPSGDS